MKKKIKVAVLMGGKTPEYEISLISGCEVVKNLPKKFEVFPVVISRNGKKWQLFGKQKLFLLEDPIKLRGTNKDIKLPEDKELVNVGQISDRVDVCFIAMHGPFGEDGTIQGMLELAGIPYTGPGILASALGMDKIMFRKILATEGIRSPKYVVIEEGEPTEKIVNSLGKPPYFVKPHNQGSSVGASIVRSNSAMPKALNLVSEYSNKALVDEYISGIEVTCGVLGNKRLVALPIVEIIPLKGEFFNYESKYTESGAEEIVPARISSSLSAKIQKIALDVYKAVGCKGFSRVDFILKDKKKPYVLEINTIPGLTPMSLLPKAAKAAGYSYPRLLEKIINYAIT